MQEKKTIYVALSGGVDSSVSAALLQKQGHDVRGVFIEVWQPDFLPCSQEEDRKSALRSAAHLGIPFYTLDARDAYKHDVVDTMVQSYQRGETPNPDVWCNRKVKFGALREWVDARGGGIIATGHYAQVRHKMPYFELLRGKDIAKDQSYFLWQLTQRDLAQTLFPVGHLVKSEVRMLAKKFGLPTAARKDSQGLCFMGAIDMKEFLTHFMPQKIGAVLDVAGQKIGEHDGALFYTFGQRHGFRIHTKDTARSEMYVVAKDINLNTITVSAESTLCNKKSIVRPIVLGEINPIVPIHPGRHTVQIRYHGKKETIILGADTTLTGLSETPAPGQSIVFYKGSECLGGGVVS